MHWSIGIDKYIPGGDRVKSKHAVEVSFIKRSDYISPLKL
jgi:hypothetical protein